MIPFTNVVGAPITRVIAGVTYSFPRLNLKEYGEVVQAWMDQEIKENTAKLKAAGKTDEEIVADNVTLKLYIQKNDGGFARLKLRFTDTAIVLIDASLKKASQSVTASMLAMDLDEILDLANELWSRRFHKAFRDSFKDDPEPTPPKTEASPAPTTG